MEFERSSRRKPRPDMMPMIDVVFHLLIFFMLFTTIKANTAGLDVELPRAVSGSVQTQATPFEVTVTKDGVFYVEGKAVTGSELRSQLQAALAVNPETFVVVKADKQVRYEFVVSALDHVRAVGGHKLGLAVEQQT